MDQTIHLIKAITALIIAVAGLLVAWKALRGPKPLPPEPPAAGYLITRDRSD